MSKGLVILIAGIWLITQTTYGELPQRALGIER